MNDTRVVQDRMFLLLVALVTVGFGWVLWPIFGAVFWAAILAILFAPLYRQICAAMNNRPTAAALMTETVIVVLVILPAALIAVSLLQEALIITQRVRSGDYSLANLMQMGLSVLPPWATALLDRFGLNDLRALQDQMSSGLGKALQLAAGRAFDFGQNTLDFVISFFVMLYLLFFTLRDGATMARRIRHSVPLRRDILQKLQDNFVKVVRATVKGNLVVAAVQGLMGGAIFWFYDIHAPVLWGVAMAFASLLPAGSAVIWLPVAIYLMATGALWKGIVLIVYGSVAIGLVDNVLRPMLVGKDTRMPDYVVLASTLGGLALFGLNGFVIGPVIAALFIAAWRIVAVETDADAR